MSNPRLWIAALLLLAPSAYGQDEEDEQPPGLRARYQVNKSVIERVDPDIAFQWADQPPDPRLPVGNFTAKWSGTLLLKGTDKFRFHAYVQGKVALKVNAQSVLEGTANQPQWISGPETELKYGDQPFKLAYERTGDAGQLKLYWSSEEFPLEPVPYHSLFQTKPSPNLTLIEQGRVQYDAFRCGNCHGDGGQSDRLPAPSLKHVGAGTNRDWLVDKLMKGAEGFGEARSEANASKADGKMPHFRFQRSEAEAIVTALESKAAPVEWTAAPKPKESERAKDLQAGAMLVRSVGCLACHTWKSLGETTPYGGGALDDVANHRTADWVTTWLGSPTKLNAHHRMPIVLLTEKERSQIVLALTESGPQSFPKAPKPNDDVVARGLKLIEEARCSNCHELPGDKRESPKLASLTDPKVDWGRSCLLAPAREKNRPSFPQVDAKALQAYVASWTAGPLVQTVRAESASSLAGSRLLQRKNCLACHDRDDVRGLSTHAAAIAKADDTLTGLHMTLIPPRLNAVGDRMHDAGLAEAIRGEQKTPRFPWLKVRMPKFAHSKQDQAALLAHLTGHDRIPDGGPAKSMVPPDSIGKPGDAQQILAGRELLGGKGFSCVACHAVKEYTPKVTALGTRGSNLHLIGQRMRTDYFFRWTRAPLRVMPGVEMPNYQKPHEFILPGQLDQQLVAIWQALNDPNLTAPTNPAVVEQLLTVGENEAPRVVRDVFTVPGTNETVARSYAIGLAGGHSMLFDLETCSLRAWTLGDFAQQRCEGKRWYWDLAGTVLATKFDKRPEVILEDLKTGEILGPETGWDFECRLIGELINPPAGGIEYEITYSKGSTKHTLHIRELFRPIQEKDRTGWERLVSLSPREFRKINEFEGSLAPRFRSATPAFRHESVKVGETLSIGPVVGLLARFQYVTTLRVASSQHSPERMLFSQPVQVTTVPGFQGQRLPLTRSIMPTAIAWNHQDRLLLTSLKGHLYRLEESASGPSLTTIEEGLAAPYGVISAALPRAVLERVKLGQDQLVERILVAHKPELLALDLDKDDKVARRTVLATGWGVTDDYHDWTCGIARDSIGNLFIGLGSDYTFKNRPLNKSKWRGDILRIDPKGQIESIARGLRYPTGFAIDDQDRLFVSDQQGVQNTFNELDYIQVGRRYGVPSRHEPEPNAPADPPTVQIPHPWTRSVNGIVFVPKNAEKLAPWAGQFIGCEMNNNMLIRMSIQTVGDVVQGAVYPFSKPAKEGDASNFVGPLCIGISPSHDIYVGGLQDGGWAGGLNVGDIVKLTPNGNVPNGIREIRATRDGFDLDFFHKVDPELAVQTSQYKLSGYTRVWKGDYATPDSGHHTGEVKSATISTDGRTVSLTVAGRKPAHVYDVSVGEIGAESQRTLWPALGHFTLHRIPGNSNEK